MFCSGGVLRCVLTDGSTPHVWEYEVLPHIVFAFLGVGKRSEEKVLAGFFGVEETKEQAGSCGEIQFARLGSSFLIPKRSICLYF